MKNNDLLFYVVVVVTLWCGFTTLYNPAIGMAVNNSLMAGIFLLLYVQTKRGI